MAAENGSIWQMPHGPSEPPVSPRLQEIALPVLVVYGDRDDPRVREAAEAAAREIPGALKEVVPGADHLLQMEEPQRFNRVLAAFLRQAERTRSRPGRPASAPSGKEQR